MKKLMSALLAVAFLGGSAFAADKATNDKAGIAEAQKEIWATQQARPAKKAKKAKKAKADAPKKEAAKAATAPAAPAK